MHRRDHQQLVTWQFAGRDAQTDIYLPHGRFGGHANVDQERLVGIVEADKLFASDARFAHFFGNDTVGQVSQLGLSFGFPSS